MTAIMLILASLAAAQSDTLPMQSLDQPSSQQALQQSLDNRFSVYGGTIAGTVYISTALWVGGAQVTGGSSSSGPSLTSTNSWSGQNLYSSDVVISSMVRISTGAYLELNNKDGTVINGSGDSVWAKSVDGAVESSGCVVAVSMSGSGANSFVQFTSTATSALDMKSVNVMAGVLLEACTPGQFCRVGVRGYYRVKLTSDPANTSLATSSAEFDVTRCGIRGTANIYNAATFGYLINGTSGQEQMVWMFLY